MWRATEDADDIRILADRLGLRPANEVIEPVPTFCAPERLPVRSLLPLEEVFDDGR